MTDTPAVHVEADAGVLLTTITRPEARNAINGAVAQGIADALDNLDHDMALRVGILTGGGGTFSAGMDLKAFVQGERPYVGDRGFAGITMRSADKPLIAAVEGWALAGGFEIALSCDLIVASSEAKFGIPEAKRGLVAAAGGLFRLPKRIPYHVAMELALTGDPVDAQRGYELGFVNHVVEPGQAVGKARELAAVIAKNGPLAVAGSKKIVRGAHDWEESEAWQKSGEIAGPIMGSHDAQEGARAFAEKRDPIWQGV